MKLMLWAELHLGAPLPEWGPLGKKRQEVLRSALEEAADTALSSSVDAVLCSGDLFDRPDPSIELADFALNQFARVYEAGISVVLLPGRYDSPSHPRSFYREDLPSELHVIRWAEGKRHEIETKSGPLHLYSLAWRPGQTPNSIWPGLSRDDSVAGPHVGLLHAHSPWSTVPLTNGLKASLDDIASTNLDLMVLGGPHNFRHEQAGKTDVVAPGTPTGLGFGEWGERRWCLATIQDGNVALETVPRDVPPVMQLEIELDLSWGLDKIKQVVMDQVPEGSLVELKLTGSSSSPLVEDVVHQVEFQNECVVEVIDEAELVLPKPSTLNVRDIFVLRMQERMYDAPKGERSYLKQALKRGLRVAARREGTHAD